MACKERLTLGTLLAQATKCKANSEVRAAQEPADAPPRARMANGGPSTPAVRDACPH